MSEEINQRDANLSSETETPQKLSRRSFLKFGLGVLSTVAVAELGGMSLLYLHSRSKEAQQGGVVTAGDVENFLPGSVTEFTNAGFYLIRTEGGDFLAVHRRCPHLGCNVTWLPEKGRFICPCHASSFDMYGDYDSPPVPRPLDMLEVRIEDQQVLIDTSKVMQREHFDPTQLTSAPQRVLLQEEGK